MNSKKIVKQLCIGGSQSFQTNAKKSIFKYRAAVRQIQIESTRLLQKKNKYTSTNIETDSNIYIDC